MKIFIYVIVLLFPFQLSAQEFYVNQANGDIALVNIATCAHRVVANIPISTVGLFNVGFGDITFTRNGRLYGVTINGKIHEINLNTNTSNVVAELPTPPNISESTNSMVSDANGLIYIASSVGRLYIFNPANSQIQQLGIIPFGAAGDLIFYKNTLYMASNDNRLIRVNVNNPAASTVFMNFSASANIFGIVSFSPTCQEVRAYAIAENSDVYEIDFNARRLVRTCRINTNNAIFGAASQLEFNAAAAINISQVNAQNADCGRADGNIRLTASGGFGALQYSIDGTNYQNQSQFLSLRNGTYRIRVRDTEGCAADTLVQLQGAGEPIINNTRTLPNACGTTQNGLIEVNASPSDNGIVSYSLDSVQFINSGLFQNLASGNYRVFVRTTSGCVVSLPFVINSLPIPAITNVQINHTSCGQNNGSLNITSNNHTNTSHQYSLDSINFRNNNIFSGLSAGNYRIFVKDSGNCVARSIAKIDSSIGLKINALNVNATTCGQNNGWISVQATWANGSPNTFLYQLNNNTPTAQNAFPNLAAQTYRLTALSTTNSCKDSILIEVKGSDSIRVSTVKIQDSDCDANNGFIRIIAKGNGQLVYKLQNTNFQKDDGFRQLPKGNYAVTIRDTQNCTITLPNILLSQSCFVFIPNAFTPNQDGNNDFFTVFGSNEYVKNVKLLRIFNRWGDLVFEGQNFACNEPSRGWNGMMNNQHLNADVFIYHAEVEFLDNRIITFKGDVTLLK